MRRPHVSVYLAISLDGFLAAEDGALAFLDRVSVAGEDYGYAAFYATVDALVVGRGTYDTVRDFPEWPWSGKRVVVMSHRAFVPRADEERADGLLAPLLERLGAEGVRRVYLDGGVLVRQGLAEGLVDDLTLSLVPVVLGRGRALFGPELPELAWDLVSATPYPSGLVQLVYERKRLPADAA